MNMTNGRHAAAILMLSVLLRGRLTAAEPGGDTLIIHQCLSVVSPSVYLRLTRAPAADATLEAEGEALGADSQPRLAQLPCGPLNEMQPQGAPQNHRAGPFPPRKLGAFVGRLDRLRKIREEHVKGQAGGHAQADDGRKVDGQQSPP